MPERVGEILVRRGSCTVQDVASALESQGRRGGKLCSHLHRLGVCAERLLCEALAEQMGIPAVVLTESALPRAAVDLVPLEVARAEGLLPVGVDDVSVTVAFASPPSPRLITEVAFATGRRVMTAAAVESCLAEAVAWAAAERGPVVRGAAVSASASVPPGGHVVTVHPWPAGPPDLAVPPEMFLDLAVSPGDGEEAGGGDVDLDLEEPGQEEPGNGRRVLVVDDVPEMRDIVRRALAPDGYHLAEAGTGSEAIRQIQVFRPELMVLDAMLPEVHGFEICRALKGSPVLRNLPVIMMSAVYKGWDYARDIQDAYGVDVFLEKPFNVALLREKVRALLARGTPAPVGDGADRGEAARASRVEAARRLGAGDLPGALEACRQGLARDPFDAKLHAVTATALARQGHVQHAMVSFERALELAPDLFPALRNLALLYEKQGFRRRAQATWQRALEACPDPSLKERIRGRLLMGLSV
jgi:CheY-like chemotaxis protein